MAVLLRLVFLLSFTLFLTSCLSSTPDLLQAATDLQNGLEILKKAQEDLNVISLSRRDPQFGRPGFGRPPFGGGRFRRPQPPAPAPPPVDDVATQLSQLINQLGTSLEALILFLKNQINVPAPSSSVAPVPTTSTQQTTVDPSTDTTSTLSVPGSSSQGPFSTTVATTATNTHDSITIGHSTTSEDNASTTFASTTSSTTDSSTKSMFETSTTTEPEVTTTSTIISTTHETSSSSSDGTVSVSHIDTTASEHSTSTSDTTTGISSTTSGDSTTGTSETTTTSESTSVSSFATSEVGTTTSDTSTCSECGTTTTDPSTTTTESSTTTTDLDATSTTSSDSSTISTNIDPSTTSSESSTTDSESTTVSTTTSESSTTSTNVDTITTSTVSSDPSTTYSGSSTTSTTDSESSTTSTSSELSATSTNEPSTTLDESSSVSSTSTSTSQTSEPTPDYEFNPQARNLNSVYFGHTTSTTPLATICEDDSIDIITIGFITGFFNGAGALDITMNQGSHCWAANLEQQAQGLLGLKDCVSDGFAAEIAACQARGKKVLISAGGVYANLTIPDAAAAEDLALTLWSLFLGGSSLYGPEVRPYGNVVLDGFDIASEKPEAKEHFPTLLSTLRDLLQTDTSKSYYLSAAPQCPRPDLSIPVPDLLSYIDFWNVQFYQNPGCQINSVGFIDALEAWSRDLQGLPPIKLARRSGAPSLASLSSRIGRRYGKYPGAVKDKHHVGSSSASHSPLSAKGRSTQHAHPKRQISFVDIDNGILSPRLLIGTPAFNWATSPGENTGYVDVVTYKGILEEVKAKELTNIAGAMFWDGGFQAVSAQDIDGVPTTYAEVVRQVLAADEAEEGGSSLAGNEDDGQEIPDEDSSGEALRA